MPKQLIEIDTDTQVVVPIELLKKARLCVEDYIEGAPVDSTDRRLLVHIESALSAPQPEQAAQPYQQRVNTWIHKCFDLHTCTDTMERNHRFLEEAIELVQSLGCTPSEAHQLVDYVFGRPVGHAPQEVGGVRVTLSALCSAAGIQEDAEAELELGRINQPEMITKIRTKHAAKPKHSPLPGWSDQKPAGRILTCVYCGHEYSQDTPAHGSKVLTDHIAQCEKHPMREVIDQRDKLKSALAGLIGVSDSAELRSMESIIRLSPAPAADKAAMLDAIHVLLNVAEQTTGLTMPQPPGGGE